MCRFRLRSVAGARTSEGQFLRREVCLFNCRPRSIGAASRRADRFQRMGITGRANRKCPAVTATGMIHLPPDLAFCKLTAWLRAKGRHFGSISWSAVASVPYQFRGPGRRPAERLVNVRGDPVLWRPPLDQRQVSLHDLSNDHLPIASRDAPATVHGCFRQDPAAADRESMKRSCVRPP